MSKNAIYVSIKPKYTKLIETGVKNYEFRNYCPKDKFNKLYVYESFPASSLKYIIEIGDIIKYPNKIKKDGYGNKEFNDGLKSAKYAYEIIGVYKYKEPLKLEILRSKFNFSPPQAYSYDSTYIELTNYIEKYEKTKII